MTISIITATFNAERTIETAIQSVLEQSYSSIEYIIIDGKSQDKTLDIVKKHNSQIYKVISEPDKGIYDALNKGIKYASGDIIGFLHADDLFYHKDTIKKIADTFTREKCDAVYGDLEYVNSQNPDKIIRYWKSCTYSPNLLKKGWMPAHPTLFIRKAIYNEIGLFKIDYKISADYEFILRFFSQNKYKASYLPLVITRMRVGGESNKSIKNIIRKSKEDLMALKKNHIGGISILIWKNVSKIPQFFKR